jgi:hypothetical protein
MARSRSGAADYNSLSPADRAALDEWRAGQIPGELALVNRFVRDVRKHDGWAKASRASGYYTAEDLDAFFRTSPRSPKDAGGVGRR